MEMKRQCGQMGWACSGKANVPWRLTPRLTPDGTLNDPCWPPEQEPHPTEEAPSMGSLQIGVKKDGLQCGTAAIKFRYLAKGASNRRVRNNHRDGGSSSGER
jgi:hypothetical protein